MPTRLALALLLIAVSACTCSDSVPVNPGRPTPTPDATRSTVVVQPPELVADGVTKSSVTVTVLDKDGTALEGMEVKIEATGDGNTLAQPSVTNASGVATGTILSTRAETKRLTLRAGTGTRAVELAQHPEVKFIPGTATRLEFLAQPASTLAGQTLAAVQVVAVDTHGNRVTEVVPVALALSGGTAGATLDGTATQASAAGVASFGDLSIQRAGTGYTLRATAPGLEAVSAAFNISAGAVSPSASTLEVGPDNVVANGADTTTVTLTVRDAFNNPVADHAVSFEASGTGNTLEPASGSTGPDGRFVATLKSTKAERKAVGATVAGAALGQRPEVSFIAGPPARLAFLNQPPASASAGQAFPALQVVVLDAQGNLATPTVRVALELTGGTSGATLGGTSSGDTTLGLVEFGGLNIQRSGTGYRLRAIAFGLQTAESNLFDILAGAVSTTTTTVEVNPNDNVVANGSAAATVTVTVRDAFNNPVAGRNVSLAVSGSANTLNPLSSGTTGADGRFVAALTSTRAETKTVTATLDGTPLAMQPQVTFIPGPAQRLAFVVQPPASTVAGQTLTPAVQVAVQDAQGNRVLSSTAPVTLALTNNVALGGTAVRAAVSGLSTFDNLHVDRAGTGYVLRATASGLDEALSTGFDITADVPSSTSSTFTASPATLAASNSETTTLTVTVLDRFNNPVSGQAVSLTASGSANTLSATSGSTGVDGTFSATFRSTVAEVKNLQATVGGLTLNATVTVTPGALANLGMVASPIELEADGVTPVSLTVTAEDTFGNRIPALTVAFSATGEANTFTPASGDTNAAGVRTATLTSTSFGVKTVRAAAGVGPNERVALATITFLRPAAKVTGLSMLGVAEGCATVQYTVSQAESARANVLVEYEVGGVFKRATQAGSLTGSGVSGIATTPAGTTHRFSWNSTADLPATNTTTRVRLTTILPGALNQEVTLDNVALTNGVRFGAAQRSLAGVGPQGLALADVDKDGRADAILTNPGAGNIAVIRGDGSGGFSLTPTLIPAGTQPRYVVARDLNRDGRVDVVVGSGSAAQASVLMGAAGGTFGAPVTVTLSGIPTGLVAGDFNRDGKLDVAVATAAGAVEMLAGNGTGSLTSTGTTAGVGTQLTQPSAGDFNRDGRLDLAVASSDGVKVLNGNDNGTFGATIATLPTGATATALRVEDANADSKLDVVVAHANSTLVVAYGQGDGNFTMGPPLPLGTQASDLAVVDVDGDTRPDVVAAGTNAVVLRGQGGGLFSAPVNLGAGGNTVAVASADLDGNGRPDVLVTRPSDDGLLRFLGTQVARCETSLAAAQQLRVDPSPSAVVLADFDGDARPDLAVASANANTVNVARGLGNGTFDTVRTAAIGTGATRPVGLVAGDFNGDGRLDLVTANGSSADVSMLLNDGAGGFNTATTWPVGAGQTPRGLAVGDFDGDKKLDLVVTDSAGTTVRVMFGNGDGTLPRSQPFNVGLAPTAVVASDLNGDGHLDLAVTNASGGTVSVLLGNGTGGFSAQRTFTGGGVPRALAVGDFNGDQRPDLAVLSSEDETVTLLRGDGNGGFVSSILTNNFTGQRPRGLAVGYFNADGHLDVASASNGQSGVTVLLGNGQGDFPTLTTVAAGAGLTGMQGADLDGDGRMDLVAAMPGNEQTSSIIDNRVAIVRGSALGATSLVASGAAGGTSADVTGDGVPELLMGANSLLLTWGNTGVAFLTPPMSTPVPGVASSVVVGDLNIDGKPDALVGNRGDNTVSVLHGNGLGGFTNAGSRSTLQGGPEALMLEDLNGDGLLDFALRPVLGQVSVGWHLNTGNGTFGTVSSVNPNVIPNSVAFADFNGDGVKDVVVGGNSGFSNTSSRVAVMLATSTGTLGTDAAVRTTTLTGQTLEPQSLAAGDVDRDGKVDLVVSLKGTASSTLYTLRGVGDGTFTFAGAPTQTVPVHAKAMSLTDLDGDGRLDLVLTSDLGIGGSAPRADSLSVLRGDGTGAFGSMRSWAVQQGPNAIVVDDFNRDGVPDFATGGSSNASVLFGR